MFINLDDGVTVKCPACHSPMKMCRHRPRTAKNEDPITLYSILICSCDCDQDEKGVIHPRYHRILPNTLIPYKQYTVATIQEYICNPDK